MELFYHSVRGLDDLVTQSDQIMTKHVIIHQSANGQIFDHFSDDVFLKGQMHSIKN